MVVVIFPKKYSTKEYHSQISIGPSNLNDKLDCSLVSPIQRAKSSLTFIPAMFPEKADNYSLTPIF
jgi:hypothetical protein